VATTTLPHFSSSSLSVRRRFKDFVSLSRLLPQHLHGRWGPSKGWRCASRTSAWLGSCCGMSSQLLAASHVCSCVPFMCCKTPPPPPSPQHTATHTSSSPNHSSPCHPPAPLYNPCCPLSAAAPSFLPARPHRNALGSARNSSEFVAERRSALERYMNRLAAHPDVARSEVGGVCFSWGGGGEAGEEKGLLICTCVSGAVGRGREGCACLVPA
jgi:hypothetical protein